MLVWGDTEARIVIEYLPPGSKVLLTLLGLLRPRRAVATLRCTSAFTIVSSCVGFRLGVGAGKQRQTNESERETRALACLNRAGSIWTRQKWRRMK